MWHNTGAWFAMTWGTPTDPRQEESRTSLCGLNSDKTMPVEGARRSDGGSLAPIDLAVRKA